MKIINKTSQRGFTLVELIIYMGLFMGFMFILSGLFVSTLDVQRESIQTATIEQDGHYVFARLQYDVGRATDLVFPANNGDTENSLLLDTPDGQVNYFLEGGQLKVTPGALETQTISSQDVRVTHLEFQRLGNEDGFPTVRMTIRLESDYFGTSNIESRVLTYTFGLR
jgi:type II secretory pathway pseudopilin PulG